MHNEDVTQSVAVGVQPDETSISGRHSPISSASAYKEPSESYQIGPQFVSQELVWFAQQTVLSTTPLPCSYSKLSNSLPFQALDEALLYRADTPLPQASQSNEIHSSLDIFAKNNIKVRDFAYESNLPPLPSIPRVRPPQMVFRPIKRQKQSHDEDGDVFAEGGSRVPQHEVALYIGGSTVDDPGGERRSRPLERKSTEPAVISEEYAHRSTHREIGYMDLSQYNSTASPGGIHASRAPLPFRHSQPFGRSFTPSPFGLHTGNPSSSQPPLIGDSQDTEPQIDTPLVTPNGSLQWQVTDASTVPASQLDTVSQTPVQEDVTYSQLGFSPPFSQNPSSQVDPAILDALNNVTPRRLERSPCPSPDSRRPAVSNFATPASTFTSPGPRSTPTTPLVISNYPKHDATPSTSPVNTPARPPSPRYYLRRRPSSPQGGNASTSTTRASRARHQAIKAASPFQSRLGTVSRQAAHSMSPKSRKDSPRARPLKKSVV